MVNRLPSEQDGSIASSFILITILLYKQKVGGIVFINIISSLYYYRKNQLLSVFGCALNIFFDKKNLFFKYLFLFSYYMIADI